MYYVYVLKSGKDGRLYKGLTDTLEKRMKQHNLGQNRSTKGFCPWELVYYEEFRTRKEARAREKYFKSGAGREFLRDLLNLGP
ncbi:GIY-YIG nuclease family protein [Flavobacteriaceae bacterium 3-367]|uniref:GIY-YIG nuclease family protein n=1 Tax=Eudoraea algarum TaxID=3417568 RepID=UPI00328163B9